MAGVRPVFETFEVLARLQVPAERMWNPTQVFMQPVHDAKVGDEKYLVFINLKKDQ